MTGGVSIDLRFGDCLDELAKVPSESIDLVATDPAYESMLRWEGVGSTARMGMGRKGTGSDNKDEKWFQTFPNENLPDLVQEIHRVLKPGRIAYIMCDFETLKLLHTFAISEGVFAPVGYGGLFEPCKPLILQWENAEEEYNAVVDWTAAWLHQFADNMYNDTVDLEQGGFQKYAEKLLEHLGSAIDNKNVAPLIWDKVIAGTGYTYRTTHEYILMLWKGKKRKLNDLSVQDILRFKKPWGNKRIFPTQKPVELFELLIQQSTMPGETVLDMFLGSGTAAKACQNTGRNFIGIEVSERAFNLAKEEILKNQQQIEEQLRLL